MPRPSSVLSSALVKGDGDVSASDDSQSSRPSRCRRRVIQLLLAALVSTGVVLLPTALEQISQEEMERPFDFTLQNGSRAPEICIDVMDTTACIVEMDDGGSCRHADWVNSSLGRFTALYYAISFSILTFGVFVLSRTAFEVTARQDGSTADRSGTPPTASDLESTTQGSALQQQAPPQHAPVLSETPNMAEVQEQTRCCCAINDPSYSFTWLGIAILVQTVGSIQMGNLQKRTLSLAESNAVDDVDSVTSVIADIFMFFEDGMTVLIGAAVGRGDATGAGTLVALGYIGSITSGVVGGAFATALAFVPGMLQHIAPFPSDSCNHTYFSDGSAGMTSETATIEMVLPYWLISVWTWSFSFANGVATGAALGSDAGFWYMSAATLGMVGAFLAFFYAVHVLGENTIAVALSKLTAQMIYFISMTYALFCDKTITKKLEPQAIRALCSKRARHWVWLAASSGAAMMLQMLCGQVRATMTVQLAARLGQGFQYRYSLFAQIQGNMWLPIIFGYAIRIQGSKIWGAGLQNHPGALYQRATFFWLCRLLLKGVCYLTAVAIMLALIFKDTLPYGYASNNICTFLESVCGAQTYHELYDQGFEISYLIWVMGLLPSAAAPFLSSALYATMDFRYVRDVSFGAVLLYVPLALCSYLLLAPAKAVLGLQFAYLLPDVILSAACLSRLYRLSCEKDSVDVAIAPQGTD